MKHNPDEQGSSLILIVFASLVCISVVLGIIAATSLYIERKRLFSLADAAALTAAEGFNLDEVTMRNGRVVINLTNAQVLTVTTRYVSALSSTDAKGVTIVSARSVDHRSSEVTLKKQWSAPVLSFFFPKGFPISVTARARTVF